jgi:hypothetical protein
MLHVDFDRRLADEQSLCDLPVAKSLTYEVVYIALTWGESLDWVVDNVDWESKSSRQVSITNVFREVNESF